MDKQLVGAQPAHGFLESLACMGDYRKWRNHPFSITVEGKGYDMAVTLARMVIVDGGTYPPLVFDKDRAKFDAVVAQVLSAKGTPVDAGALRAWVGQPSPLLRETCWACHGDRCDFCDEKGGWMERKRRPARLGGTIIDRSLLAEVLMHVEGPDRIAVATPMIPFIFIGEGWRVAVMPMASNTETEGEGFPVTR